jgi:hypothetical protein
MNAQQLPNCSPQRDLSTVVFSITWSFVEGFRMHSSRPQELDWTLCACAIVNCCMGAKRRCLELCLLQVIDAYSY